MFDVVGDINKELKHKIKRQLSPNRIESFFVSNKNNYYNMERIVSNTEIVNIKRSYAGQYIDGFNELNHFTHYYEIFSAEAVECSSNYCNKPAIILKYERDHMGQNFVAFMCNNCAPNL